MRGELHRPVVGRWRGRSEVRLSGDRGTTSGGGVTNRRIGGRVLLSGGGTRLVLRASSGDGTMRVGCAAFPSEASARRRATPTRNPPVLSATEFRRTPAAAQHRLEEELAPAASRSLVRPATQAAPGDPKERQPSLRPTDPDTHPPLSPGAGLSPRKLSDGRTGAPRQNTQARLSAARFHQGPPSQPDRIRSKQCLAPG